MGYVKFDFGSSYNEKTKYNADKLVEKIDDLLERFDLGANEFFNVILPNTIGFYVSSSNMNREPEEQVNLQGKKSVKISNFFFRLNLDRQANGLLKGNTVVLKGDLSIKDDVRNNCVFVRDIYLAPQTNGLFYEGYFEGVVNYRNAEKTHFDIINDVTMDYFNCAKVVPYIVDREKFNKFISDWRTYLEFEKEAAIGNIKQYSISGNIKIDLAYKIDDNAVNREKYDRYIIADGKRNLFVDRNSPELNGDEKPSFLVSINVEGSLFGNTKEDIFRSAKRFVNLGLSVIGQKQCNDLDELIKQLKMKDEKRQNRKELDIEGFNLDDWLLPVYDPVTKKVKFRFYITDEDEYGRTADPKSRIEKFGDKLFLAHIASGDIALYKRGKEVLNKLETGDVKNPPLAGFIIEPEKFENEIDNFNEKNVEFALKDLNRSQKTAVAKCLNSNSIFLLQGPPGTGKTQTITELVYQFNKMGKKVLLSSQTHIAIDNVIERLPKDMNILPIRLMRDRSKARNEQYLPDRLLDNLYDAAYNKYRKKREDFETNEKNINDIKDCFETNKSIHENIKIRLSAVKKLEDGRGVLRKNLSNLRSYENESDSELRGINKSLDIFEEYSRTKLSFESVLDEYVYTPLLEKLHTLAGKYKFTAQDDIYNYAVLFKKAAGKARISYLESLSDGGKKPAELEAAENKVNEVQKEMDTFKQYKSKIPDELIKKMNEALQAKKNADRKYETSGGGKNLNIAKENFYFVNPCGDVKLVIAEELKAIKGFVKEYEEVLRNVFNNTQKDKLANDKDILETKIKKTENDIRRILVEIDNIENDITQQSMPIESNRKKLEEYFVSFYTDKLNGASLPETEEAKLKDIHEFIEGEKRKFDAYKIEYKKLKDIYSSLESYLADRQDFVESQRGKYTKNLLKHNANVYGLTCTSTSYFYPDSIVGRKNDEDDPNNDIEVDNINIRDIDFDVVIIDEVSKATPIEILIPLVYGRSVVLVGDQRQLPPIFKYNRSMFEDMTHEKRTEILQGKELKYFQDMVETSLFERIYKKISKKNRAMLTEQYRFHEQIMKCVNVFYDGKLSLGLGKDQNNKKQHYLDVDIQNFKGGKTPVFCRKDSTYWFDSHFWKDRTVAYTKYEEGETSYRNQLEVKITVELLLLLENGYGELKTRNPEEYQLATGDGKKPSVAVISMYGKHIDSIKKELRARNKPLRSFKNIFVDVSTVDNYQGKEQDIVIVNMVANLENRKASEFLQKFNRINVAISRARTMLIMVGSRTFYNKVTVNVPNMDTGKDNPVNAYYQIYDKCESKWAASADLFGISKEGVKA